MLEFDSVQTLIEQIPSIRWFSRLGDGAGPADGVVYWKSLDSWHEAIHTFYENNTLNGVPHTEQGLDFGWLLPDRYEHDEKFRASLNAIRASGRAGEIQSAVTDVYRSVIASIGYRFPSNAWLQVDGVEMQTLALNLATFAFGQTAKEILAGTGTFWRRVAELYSDGRMPVGKVRGSGAIVTI